MKIKLIPSILFTQIIVLCFSAAVYSQSNPNYSPVKWENYRVGDAKAAFLMPRLPIVVNESNYCRGEETKTYGAYTNGAAYVVRITSKFDVPKYCSEKKNFDENNFAERLAVLKNSPSALTENEAKNSGEVVFTSAERMHKLVNDFKNKRWFELLVVGAVENKPEVKNFLASLVTGKNAAGIEIGDGADRVIGDEPEPNIEIITKENPDGNRSGRGNGVGSSVVTPKPEISSNTRNVEGVKIILKPRSNYTEMARSNQTQGKVLLRVTFSASGGIGAISVISGLSDGLTEQAIAAARKILFIPASRQGIRYSVTKPVEYTFAIY